MVSNTINVYGNFEVSGGSTVSTSVRLNFYGNFDVDSESSYDSNNDYTFFLGETNQNININGNVTFAGIYCKSTAATKKIIHGSINSTAYVRSFGNATIEDDANTYHHTFVGATVACAVSFKSPMTIKGGTLRKTETTEYGQFTLGTGDITIQTNDVSVKAGDTLIVKGDITVETGSLVIAGTEEKQAEVYGNEDNTSTLTVYDGARLYIRGGADAFANDNFPKRFASVTLGESSTTYYDSKFNQKVHGATYGHLALDYYDKTFTGNSFIAGHLYMRPMTNGESTVYFGDYSHTLCYNFYDEPDRKGTTSIK